MSVNFRRENTCYGGKTQRLGPWFWEWSAKLVFWTWDSSSNGTQDLFVIRSGSFLFNSSNRDSLWKGEWKKHKSCTNAKLKRLNWPLVELPNHSGSTRLGLVPPTKKKKKKTDATHWIITLENQATANCGGRCVQIFRVIPRWNYSQPGDAADGAQAHKFKTKASTETIPSWLFSVKSLGFVISLNKSFLQSFGSEKE